MEKKIASKIILASFIVIICLSQVLWFFFERYVDSTNYENRSLATRPELTLDSYNTFSDEYESYYNDNLQFRNSLIMLNTSVDYFVFSKSTNSRVIVGKDDWLFYGDANDGDPVSCYQGTNLLSEDELQALAQNCVNIKEYLNSQGKEFIIFIAPNKERIYFDKMPKKYGNPADMYRALQVVTYLRENTDVRVVYPYDELMEAKNTLNENIYYRTDTHWNWLGGYVGACSLMKELGIEMPNISSDEISIVQRDNISGDLAGMLNLNKLLRNKDSEFSVKGYNEHNVQNVEWDFYNAIVYHAEGADPRKIYINRDSFSSHMSDYIGSQFNDSFLRHTSSYSYDDFVQQNPDIFVYETVERCVGRLASFSIE